MSEPDSACPVKEGDIIAGKFKVERVLGMGGMGVVVAAMHLELDTRVALKFLLPQAASHPSVAERFAREARAAAKIKCEHVARVIDVGTLPGGAPYMVMEYMDGEDLEHVLERCGPMPVDLATTYVLQASEALAEAHAVGIVHRDLKPANLFLANRPNGDPIVKVLDFGISKSTLSSSQAQLTKTSSIMGSPLYMSPEQMTSAKSVDVRSDIWALGVVLYELLTKSTPFPADTMPELVAAILQRQQDPVRTLRPDVPPGLDAVIQRCLQKNPAERFPNVAELAVAIAPYGRPGSGTSVQRISHVLRLDSSHMAVAGGGAAFGPGAMPTHHGAPTQGAVPQAAAATNSPWAQSLPGASPPKGRLGLLIGGPLLLVALLGVGALMLRRPSVPTLASGPLAASAASAVPSSVAANAAPPSVAATSPAAPANPSPANAAPPSPAPVIAAPEPAAAARAPGRHPSGAAAITAAIPAVAPSTRPATPTVAAAPQPASAKPAAPTATGPVCKLVSYIDADGNKRFTNECK